ncbi:YozQ family protein [Salirhabdus salicampi]|uniref:YozQ family protein n=1 Tax=Salirhabdus salicampi TaxID=476102 RepID=UPI0020C5685D|nr:YozQ family protein [Salirhabdus salicampi]MCP8618130.1 YozQ family protein [Salirhabdus salicampi]
MAHKHKNNKSVADKYYEPEDYKRNDQLSSGIAETHEQTSDTLTEGTIDGKIERPNGKAEDIPRKGYNE